MPLDPQSQHLLEESAKAGAPAISAGSPQQAREAFAAIGSMLAPGDVDVIVSDGTMPIDGGEIAIREILPTEEPLGTIVFFHGGGWVIGGLEAHTPLCRVLAAASGCRVVMPDYRVAPEYPFPIPVEDCDRALEWVVDRYGKHAPVLVGGDSAGANLAAVTARHARDNGIALAMQVLLYPVTDWRTDSDSHVQHSAGYIITGEDMDWFWGHYVPDPARRGDPDASPLRAETLAGVAPAYISTAEYDLLRDDGIDYAARLREHGVEVTAEHFDDQMHGFALMIGLFDVAERSVRSAAAAIRNTLSARVGS